MFCSKCGNEFDGSNQCPRCGIDINIYNKTKLISIKLYNKGLEQINMNNLSGAIDSLTKSLSFDKTNCNSRNLLGLIYFETGETGEALKQWVISNSFIKENNLAKEYIDIMQNDTNKLERYSDAIKIYNKALEYSKQKSEDMAIIQLKKALDLNPKFLEAYNLLALCYICENDNEKALLYIEKALEIDISNEKALSYYGHLKKSNQRTLKVDKSVKSPSNNKYSKPIKSESKVQKKSNLFGQISGFLFGGVVIAVFIFILVIPSIKEQYGNKIEQLNQDNILTKEELSRIKVSNDEAMKKLEQENEALKLQNENLNQELTLKQQVQQVQQISELYNNGNKEEAGQLLLSLSEKSANFPEETKVFYNSLKEKILPDLAKIYYNDGRTQYNAKKYEQARALFEKSFSMAADQSFSGDVLYYIGRIDEINGNIENARVMYQRVLDEYPKSSQFYYARTRLAGLK